MKRVPKRQKLSAVEQLPGDGVSTKRERGRTCDDSVAWLANRRWEIPERGYGRIKL